MAILVQLRSGHAQLNKHLHRIKCSQTNICPACRREPETVHHFLFRCKAYDNLRRLVQRKHEHNARSAKFLLVNPDAFSMLFRYINGTKRFMNVTGPMKVPQEDNRKRARRRR
ncbi:hypothetical protein M422DRAFT_190404 [Sphaerobolus stellatus SS14]|uniref:Reverse transcriptase zinc-binding domain-containing protein n=1 Tax=Sphaerobolus stellatus (strain SS14) TaxID=990650 RepID=A0A0C9UG26_SPHS4|nr:hypothetical protein M422DRAFT_190404 [Sphaerobolus stellatus SS14]